MKILLVTETFAPATDPAAETGRHVVDALITSGHDVRVLTTGPGTRSFRGARIERTRALFSLASVRRVHAEFDPDVAQVLAPRAMGASAMRTLDALGVPVVVLDPTPLHPRVGTVLTSSESAGRLLGSTGIPTRLWRPGLRTDEHHPGLRDHVLHGRWSQGGTVVGYVGPVGQPATKVVRRLARIAALPDVRLVVLGRGPGTAVLKEAGAKILGDATGLEQARVIASFDVLVQPHKQDARLSVVRKALASAVPVVAFATGAAAEVVQDGRTGVLVERTKGPDGLLATVARLAADPALRTRLGEAGRDSVLSRTWQDAVEELVEIYRPLLVAA